jgi:pullulanase
MMKQIIVLCILLSVGSLIIAARLFAQSTPGKAKSSAKSLAYNPYEKYPVYQGNDLGVRYSAEKTVLKVWSPPAQGMKLRLYRTSTGNDLVEEVTCRRDKDGVWMAELKGDRKNLYYVFQAQIKGKWGAEVPDPYATAVGVNGKRGQIVDLAETDPPGWKTDQSPKLTAPVDAILYELHVRDLSIAANSGIVHKGKFLAFTETGTKNSHGQSTGIDHIAETGITHVHLLPSFDFVSVDESKPDVPQYNWGYDPQNYNVPEGSYSTDPEDGKVRIREFKEMVMALHRKGLGVVMDVVYNHTGRTHDSNFDQLVPGYYYRQWQKDGSYSNASGCGNETASDREMVRKFIIESALYWMNEYHIDGFRFDLMAIHDIETMNKISSALHAVNPSVIIYGEGWTAGDSPLPEQYRALKKHAYEMNGVAVFSDDIRDAIKGSVFEDNSTGFASGARDMAETVKFGIAGAGMHPQVDCSLVKYSKEPYTREPGEVINYVSCHDNNTLYDKLEISRPDATEEELVMMHKLSNTIVMTSQGIAFLHAGVEMKRTKGGEHNSFNKPDSVNEINWEWKFENKELVSYYHELVALRKSHPAFRLPTGEMVRRHLEFLTTGDPQLIAYTLKNNANGDRWKDIFVAFNGSNTEKRVGLPAGKWKAALRDYQFEEEAVTLSGSASLPKYSAMILYRE